MDKRRWIGGVSLAGILALVAASQSSLLIFYNAPSLALTLVGGTAAWLAMSGRGVSDLWTTLRTPGASAGQLAEALHTVQTGRRAFWVTGGLGTLIGLVQLLQQLDDPGVIGPSTAVALLTLLYAFLANVFILSPVEKAIITRRIVLHSAEDRPLLNQERAASRDALEALRQRTRATVPDGH